jgi:hypothetical protein
MEGERIARALSRIETAAARIERAAARSPAAAGAPDLESRYADLRRETGAALEELDRLIGAIEP